MPRNCSSATCPIPWGSRVSPPTRQRGEARVARNPGITTLKWQLARGAGQPGTWGNSLAGSPLGWRTLRGRASLTARPGASLPCTHACPPRSGVPEEEPLNSHYSCPRTPVPCALKPQRHGSRVASREPLQAPSPLPCLQRPLPSSAPAALLAALRPARGSHWPTSLSLPRKRPD